MKPAPTLGDAADLLAMLTTAAVWAEVRTTAGRERFDVCIGRARLMEAAYRGELSSPLSDALARLADGDAPSTTDDDEVTRD